MIRLAVDAAWLLLASLPLGFIVAALARLAERRLSVSLRAAAWRAAMGVTISPLLLGPLAALLPKVHEAATAATPAAGLMRQVASLTFALAEPGKASPLVPILVGLLSVWACGALLALGGLAGRWLRLAALVKSAEPFAAENMPLGPPPARLSDGVRSPLLAGLIRPVILIPRFIAAGLSAAELSMILAHERAHLARRDNARALAYDLVVALLWFNPAPRLIRTRAAAVRELLCDADVLAAAEPAQRRIYAQTLVTALRLGAGPEAAPALINPEHGSLVMRLNAILKPPARPSRIRVLLAAGLIGTTALLGAGAALALGTVVRAAGDRQATEVSHRSGATFSPKINIWADEAQFEKGACRSVWNGNAVLQSPGFATMNADRITFVMVKAAGGSCGANLSATGEGHVVIVRDGAAKTGSRGVLDLRTGEVTVEP